jgi:hypothetical protein
MHLRFYMDPRTGLPHVNGHDVTEAEVEEAMAAPGEDRAGEGGSRVAIGQTQSGRYLRIIYVPDADGDGMFVITAYTLEGKALAAYKKRRKK